MIFTRGITAFAGGAVAALIASRVLPPIIAQTGGTARRMAGGDPFEALARDHRAFLSLLADMEESADGAAMGRTQRLLRLKRRLAAHALAEEDIVYPLLGDRPEAADHADQLYREHAEIKKHLYALEHMPKGDSAWRDRVHALRTLIASHARQEEEVEFPALRAMLDERAMRRLSGEVEREKALIL